MSKPTQEDKDNILVNTLKFMGDSLIAFDKRLRKVEEALQSTQDFLLKVFPDDLSKSDIKTESEEDEEK